MELLLNYKPQKWAKPNPHEKEEVTTSRKLWNINRAVDKMGDDAKMNTQKYHNTYLKDYYSHNERNPNLRIPRQWSPCWQTTKCYKCVTADISHSRNKTGENVDAAAADDDDDEQYLADTWASWVHTMVSSVQRGTCTSHHQTACLLPINSTDNVLS